MLVWKFWSLPHGEAFSAHLTYSKRWGCGYWQMLTRAHSHDKAVEIFSYIARYEHSTAYIVGTRLTEWPTKMSTVFLALFSSCFGYTRITTDHIQILLQRESSAKVDERAVTTGSFEQRCESRPGVIVCCNLPANSLHSINLQSTKIVLSSRV